MIRAYLWLCAVEKHKVMKIKPNNIVFNEIEAFPDNGGINQIINGTNENISVL